MGGDDNASGMIKLVAGLVITLLVIGIGFSIYNTAKETTDTVQSDIASFNTTLTDAKYTDIEGDTLLGNQVSSYISQYANTEIAIQVVSKSGTTTFYNYSDQDMTNVIDATTNAQNIAAAKSKSSASYINPNGKFLCSLYRDSSDTIKCVIFTQQ